MGALMVSLLAENGAGRGQRRERLVCW